jgi:SAM-dependent methyltransferase
VNVRDRLLEHTASYRLWQAPFVEQKLAPFRRQNDLSRAGRVLDVGCGPGTNAAVFSDVEYLGVDINERYVRDARKRYGERFAVADVTRDDFAEGTFDLILLNSLLHHLDDAGSANLLSALRRHLAPGGRIHVIDLVLPRGRGIPRLLARLDRGDFPRPIGDWSELVGRDYELEVLEPFAVKLAGVDLWHLVYMRAAARR